MVRGHAKADAQARAAKKAESSKKAGSQRGQAERAMNTQCPICKQQMPTPKQLKDHYDSRHPRDALPAEIQAFLDEAAAQQAAACAPCANSTAGAAEDRSANSTAAPKKVKKKKADAGLALLEEGLAGSKKKGAK